MQKRPKAYLFDVFGTVVNWRYSLAKGLEASARKVVEEGTSSGVDAAVLERARGMTFSDWEWFAFQWYQRYIDSRAVSEKKGGGDDVKQPSGGKTAAGFVHQEELHRRNLVTLISEFQLEGLWTTPQQTGQLVHLWHELDAWPDSAEAIARFAKLGPAAALSDGSVALLTSLDTRNGLQFDEIWGSDTWMAYKPDPSVYLGAVKKLGLEPDEVALVAAHLGDLWGAKQCGLKTLYVERAFEERFTEDEVEEARRDGWVDMWVPYAPGKGLLGVVEGLEGMEA
ncbi:2-haloacid dehalogenase [Apiospora saccharicola]|uniref:2-haloacid dehalogenase n=1 Tax=Apiospora saccharicola TaxID=335842 RepID=A0ABR1UX35_9PEZI